MKKLLLIALAAAGAVLANRKIKAGQQEQALWAEATDNVGVRVPLAPRAPEAQPAQPAPGPWRNW